MLCIKLHPPNIENAPPSEPKLHPPLNRNCTPSEPKLHPLTRFLSKLESFAKMKSRSQGLLFALAKQKEGFEQGGSRRSLRKKTVRWTVFADGVKERCDAKVHGSAPKKSLTLRQNEKQVARPAFFFGKTTKRGVRTRREQTKSAEENSPVDCFLPTGSRSDATRRCTGVHRKNP